MESKLFRLTFGLISAGTLAALTAIAATAGSNPTPVAAGDLTCQACHESIHLTWESGGHSQATANEAFRSAWEDSGQPPECLACHTTNYDPGTHTWEAEGVACQACHGPAPANHPQEPMPTDRTAGACGECHTDIAFAFQVSRHKEVDLACVACHDPHGADLKTVDSGSLCAGCHQERASNFAHSAHSEVGLTCADCHLAQVAGTVEGTHTVRDHSFHVRLDTCTDCHAFQIHESGGVAPEGSVEAPGGDLASSGNASVMAEPSPVGPLGFAVLAGLVGMAGGMVLAPWLERWYQRVRRDSKGA